MVEISPNHAGEVDDVKLKEAVEGVSCSLQQIHNEEDTQCLTLAYATKKDSVALSVIISLCLGADSCRCIMFWNAPKIPKSVCAWSVLSNALWEWK